MMRCVFCGIVAAAALILLFGGAGSAAAQSAARPAAKTTPKPTGAAKTAKPKMKDKTRGSELESFEIVGKIYKPEVFLFLGRKKLNLDWDLADARFRKSFIERILRPVWERPF